MLEHAPHAALVDVAVDPDSELITATAVTAGNVGDARAAGDLLTDDASGPEPAATDEPTAASQCAGADQSGAEPDDDAEDERLAIYGDSA